jgi:hypothetical protein
LLHHGLTICLMMSLAAPFGVVSSAQQTTPGQQTGTTSSSQPEQQQPSNSSQSPSTSQPASGNQQPSQSPQQGGNAAPVGTAAAPYEKGIGIAASRPAGVVIAPAKQRRTRSLLIRVGLLVGAAAAIGTVVALSKASPSEPSH